MNKVELSGKVVSDIALRKTTGGKSVLTYRLMYKSENTKHPLFIDIEMWEGAAERASKVITRGSVVNITGELRRDVWEKDGKEISKIKIVTSGFNVEGAQSQTQKTEEVASVTETSERPF